MIQELREKVQKGGGFMIAAHPFRGFKTFGIGQLQLTVEQAAKRKMFEFVDAVEIGNGKLSKNENDMARKVAEKLGLREPEAAMPTGSMRLQPGQPFLTMISKTKFNWSKNCMPEGSGRNTIAKSRGHSAKRQDTRSYRRGQIYEFESGPALVRLDGLMLISSRLIIMRDG